MELCLGARALSGIDPVESALVERAKRQDLEAFGKIVDAYQNRVFGFVRRMVRDAEESADLTQEVFIRAFQSFSRFDGRSSLRTWLFRIAYNLCVDRARKIGRSPSEYSFESATEEEQPMEFADSRWDPESVVMDGELATVVEEGIASMSEKLRSVLLLHDRDDLAYDEIAAVLKVPVGTVKSRLFLARAHLQGVVSSYLNREAKNI